MEIVQQSPPENDEPAPSEPAPTESDTKEPIDTEPPKSATEEPPAQPETIDSNKIVDGEDTGTVDDDKSVAECDDNEDENDEGLGIIDEDLEKSALDAKERSSDSSSDGEWKNKEPSWEELGLVDDEVLDDFHNKVSL